MEHLVTVDLDLVITEAVVIRSATCINCTARLFGELIEILDGDATGRLDAEGVSTLAADYGHAAANTQGVITLATEDGGVGV